MNDDGDHPEHTSDPRFRLESGDDVLDTDAPSAAERRGFRAAQRLADRFPKAQRALGMVLLAAVAATAGGQWRHAADQRDATKAARGTVLLRLLDGGAVVSPDASGGSRRNTSADEPQSSSSFARLTFTVRNDGPDRLNILGAAVHDEGVRVLPQPFAPVAAAPDQPLSLALTASADCSNAQLPRRPGALTLTVRDDAGQVRQVTIGDPLPDSATASAPTGADYFALCGLSQTSITPDIRYDRLVATATAADPTFSYQVTVTGRSSLPQMLEATHPLTDGVPGLTVTAGLPDPVLLSVGDTHPVVISVHAADCARIGEALAPGTRSRVAGQRGLRVDALFAGSGLEVAPGDQRFPQAGTAVDPPLSAGFYADVLSQILAACPSLG